MRRILLVDNDIEILKALSRMLFINSDSEYEVLTAKSGAEALEIMKKEEIDLLISDMRMPVMDGIQLLSQVKQLYPGVVRMILSGYPDKKNIYNAVNDNIANIYLLKPWTNEGLLMSIKQIFEAQDLLIKRCDA